MVERGRGIIARGEIRSGLRAAGERIQRAARRAVEGAGLAGGILTSSVERNARRLFATTSPNSISMKLPELSAWMALQMYIMSRQVSAISVSQSGAAS